MTDGLDARKPQELLCYLLINSNRPQYREVLAERLWADHFHDQSKKYLRKALWQLQMFLSQSEENEQQPFLLVEPEWIQINPAASLWVDALAFEKSYQSVRGIHGRNLTTEQFQALQAAQELYTGDLLEGCYTDWCVHERVRFQDMYLAMLDKMIGYSLKYGLYDLGAEFGEKILAYDHARERTHRRLMRLRYLAGDRSGALRQFERCAAALRNELNVAPSKRTLALKERIENDQLDTGSPPDEGSVQVPSASADGVNKARLKELLLELGRIYKKLSQEIERLDRDSR